MKTILYFTAGRTPTSGELAEIAALNVRALPAYSVKVLNGVDAANYGTNLVPGDYTAGTVPAAYLDEGEPIYPTFDPAAPPHPDSLPATQAIVTNGDAVTVAGSNGTAAIAVSAGAVTGATLTLPETKAIVTHGQEIAVTGGTVTISVVEGVLSAAYVAD